MQFKGKGRAFTACLSITLILFAFTNIWDHLAGRSNYTINYPIVLFIIWTMCIAIFLYLGWNIAFLINGIPFLALMIYTVFDHAPRPISGVLESVKWLVGILPIPSQWLVFFPSMFAVSIIIQLIVGRKSVNVGAEEEDDEEAEYQ